MIYFDTNYILKCYLDEPGAEEVRELFQRNPRNVASSRLGRTESHAALRAKVLDKKLTAEDARQARLEMDRDEWEGLWTWLPFPEPMCDEVALRLHTITYEGRLRSLDAIHLETAAREEVSTFYSHDGHALKGAVAYGLVAEDVIL